MIPIALRCSIKNSGLAAGIAVMALSIVLPASSQAASLLGKRADLPSNDQLDWSSLGFTPPFQILDNTFSASSQQGLTLKVQIPQAVSPTITPPLIFQTLPSPIGIPTNFAQGDFILFTGNAPGTFPANGNPGPITITFDQPVFSAGAQIAVDDTPNFIASIAAFDGNNNLLGGFSMPATSSIALDNSAQFLGIQSETANISRLEFSSSQPERAIGINTLSIQAKPIPEPPLTTATIIGAGWLSLLARSRKQRSN